MWAKGTRDRGWHRVSWSTLTQGKRADGLGIRDMVTSNTTLMGKAAWSMMAHPRKLWVRVMQSKYLNQDSSLQVKSKPRDSPIWRGILKPRDQLQEGFNFRLGDGLSSLWYADWSGQGKLA